MKSSGAALFTACGPAMSCPARHFLPGACPLPHSATGYFHPRKKTPHDGGVFSIPAGAGSAALLQAVDGKGIEPEALIKPESCLVALGHTEFPGAALSPALPPGTSFPRKKAPHGGGVFSIPAGAGSAALLQAVDGKGIEPEALIKPESCFIAIGHTEFPGPDAVDIQTGKSHLEQLLPHALAPVLLQQVEHFNLSEVSRL